MPIAHGEGNYVSPVETDPAGVLLRYCDADGNITPSANPNGSRDNIAGLVNTDGNVFGLMPHPERAAWAFNVAFLDPAHRKREPHSTVGAHIIFQSMSQALRARERQSGWA